MEIRILGAHNVESANTRLTSLLVDGVLAVDAGALTSSLTFAEQEKVSSILLTHCHYDHIRDVPAIALNISYVRKLSRFILRPARWNAILNNVLNDVIYPNFTERPNGKAGTQILPPGAYTRPRMWMAIK